MENCGDLLSRRIKSNRRCWPITNSFLPSTLGVGLLNISGPTVSCVGSVPALRNRDAPSRIAQMFWLWSRVDSNRKYSPSGVQVPPESCAGLFHSGDTECKPLPSAETSHNEEVRWLVSLMVKRKRRPSGENRGAKGTPGREMSSRESVPSGLHVYKLEFLA